MKAIEATQQRGRELFHKEIKNHRSKSHNALELKNGLESETEHELDDRSFPTRFQLWSTHEKPLGVLQSNQRR